MRFWFSVHLPLLPLECLRPRWCEPGPYAVVEKGRILAVSQHAYAEGVRIGMRPGGVAAVSPDSVILERNLERELITSNAIALALLQFTPEVAHAGDFSLLLDVTASLRLFNGRAAISRRIRAALQALGVTAQLGTAPTAMGAWLLSRWQPAKRQIIVRRTVHMRSLERQLDRMPCAYLPSTANHLEWLTDIGADHLAALRRLPRPGIQRRMNKHVLDELDRAYGLAPELFEWIAIPETFSARIETFDRIEHADALLDGATGLLQQFVGWLVARQQAVSVFVLLLEHERGKTAIPPTPIEIGLAEPTWRDAHLIRLLKERLARTELVAPVIALRLEARLLTAMAPPTQDLFPEPGGTPADYKRLLELLSARLGSDNVLSPVEHHDHRPEESNAWAAATEKRKAVNAEDEAFERPFWLLPKPIPLLLRGERPFYGSPLKMLKGPERIEAGWWNDQIAARDYYIAQGSDATCYWIYLERVVDGRWYLHGMFG